MMSISRIQKTCAVMTRDNAIAYLDRIIKALEEDCEAFGEAPEDTAKLQALYRLKKKLWLVAGAIGIIRLSAADTAIEVMSDRSPV